MSGEPLFDALGAFKGYRGVGTNVTQRREAEARALQSEQSLRAAIDAAPYGIAVTNSEGMLVLHNAAFTLLFGFEATQAADPEAWFARAFPDPAYRDKVARIWWKEVIVATRLTRFDSPLKIRRGADDERQVEIIVVPLVGGRRLVTFNDLTERLRAEEEARRSAEEYRGLIRTTTDGFFMAGKDLRLIDVNDAYCELAGYSREELLSMSMLQLDAPESEGEIVERVLRIVGMGSDRFEARLRCKDGRMLEIDMSVTWVAASERLFAFVRDISERKRLVELRLHSQKLESLGTLAGGIAHDFNNILAAIRGNTELAAEDVGEGHPAMESLTEIRKAGSRASELVRRITAFGRPTQPARETVDLASVVEEVLKLLRATLPAGIVLRTQFDEAVPRVRVDAAQVHEVLVNLTTNAAYAIGPRTGSIVYELTAARLNAEEAGRLGLAEGNYARLTVGDSGCGMDEATMARIFDVFFTTKPVGVGSGLGLSMVYGIMQGHGGTVTVESKPGRGSSFRLHFPVLRTAEMRVS